MSLETLSAHELLQIAAPIYGALMKGEQPDVPRSRELADASLRLAIRLVERASVDHHDLYTELEKHGITLTL